MSLLSGKNVQKTAFYELFGKYGSGFPNEFMRNYSVAKVNSFIFVCLFFHIFGQLF